MNSKELKTLVVLIFAFISIMLIWIASDKQAEERLRSAVETTKDVSPPMPSFNRVSRQGSYQFVYIEIPDSLKTDRDSYMRVAEYLCHAERICIIGFWNNASLMAKSLPMTDEQLYARIAQYNRNLNTGYDKLVICDDEGWCN